MMRHLQLLTRQRPRVIVAELVVLAAVVLAVIGGWLAPYDPEQPTIDVLAGPSRTHLLGTDASGIDVLSVVVAAFRVDVLIAVVSIGISLIAGVALGALSGYSFNRSRSAGMSSTIILRALDLVQSIPVFILALALVGMAGQSVRNVVIAVAFVNLPVFARLTRSAIQGIEHREFVSASRAIGIREFGILRSHVMPNSLDSTIAYASIAVGGAILLTAGLSFLGAGVKPPTPEWGAEIASGSGYIITGEWWISVIPGIVLSTVVLSFALLGDGIRVALQRAHREGELAEHEPSTFIEESIEERVGSA
jgi:peptide/nickel transport system permease protein